MSPLADLRILVVEDEVFIAWEIEQRLQRLGCEVVGPVGHLKRALQLARTTALDGALLDVNIKGGVVYPGEKVVAFLRDHSDEAMEVLAKSGIKNKLPGGLGDKLGGLF